jgi:glycosyltransferase involved in cell wall biosynthesis
MLSRLAYNRSPEYKYKVVVYDDNSKSNTEELCRQNYPEEIIHAYATRQSGVAAGKNYCLKVLKECDYIFLFDDDCFPKLQGWEACYIDASRRSGDHVLIYTRQGALHVHKIIEKGDAVNYFSIGAGCLLFITRRALTELGGFNPNYSFYGHEHNGYCVRAQRAGLNRKAFAVPVDAINYIHSLDIDGSQRYKMIVGKFDSADPLPMRDYYERQGRAAWQEDLHGKLRKYEL